MTIQRPAFETRAEAETHREDLQMQGYERSMGWDLELWRGPRGFEVILHRIRPDHSEES